MGGDDYAENAKARMRLRELPRLAVEGCQYCEEHKKLMESRYNRHERSPDVHKKYGRACARIRARYVR